MSYKQRLMMKVKAKKSGYILRLIVLCIAAIALSLWSAAASAEPVVVHPPGPFPAPVYRERREALMKKMGKHSSMQLKFGKRTQQKY